MAEFLAFSKTESLRFGYKVFRGTGRPVRDGMELLSESCAERADIVILRTGISELNRLFDQLGQRCHAIWADTLLEYRKTLIPGTVADFLDAGARIVEATEPDRPMLVDLIRRCYAEYQNHYFANPCLNTDYVLAGLIEYSLSFLSHPDRTIFVAYLDDSPCGYLCMDIEDGVGTNPIGGSALDIGMQKRHKILCDLTHFGDRWLLERGVRQFRAVTRTDKTYIQKLLVRNMHCLPAKTVGTLHINMFLAAMQKPGVDCKSPPWPKSHPAPGESIIACGTSLGVATGPVREDSFAIMKPDACYYYTALSDKTGIKGLSFLKHSQIRFPE